MIDKEMIDEIKDYLNAYDEDDKVIETIILEAEAYIMATAGDSYKTNESKVRLSKLLIKKLAADFYDNRGTNISTTVKQDKITQTILDVLSNGGD